MPSPHPHPVMTSTSLCLLLTVGNGARGQTAHLVQGLIQTLQHRRPAHFLLLPSRARDSLAGAKQVLRGLDPATRAAFVPWSDEQPFLCIERHDDLESARATVREALREIRRRFPAAAVVIQAASGTRAMAAGATLAALDEGLGLVELAAGPRGAEAAAGGPALSGAFDAARWRADGDLAHAARCWERQQWVPAAELLEGAAAHLPAHEGLRQRLAGLALAAAGFAAKESFQFPEAGMRLLEARQHWRLEQPETPAALRELGKVCKETADRCARFAKLQGGERSLPVLRDLIAEAVDQSIRAARFERYDEACARLWRAIEMELQARMAEATGGSFWSGRLVKGGKVPEALRTPAFLAQLQRTELPREWPAEALVHALHALGHPSVAELRQDLTDWRGQSEWRASTAARDGSILAHGILPVDKTGHKNLRKAAGRFLGLQLAESHPVPAFDRNWLE